MSKQLRAVPLVLPWLLRGSWWPHWLAVVILAACGRTEPTMAMQPYQHFLVGDPADVVRPKPAAASVVLMGGGPSVADAFRWMIRKSAGGNFVVIRAAGTDAYNSYIYSLGDVSSVETLVIPSREAANDPFVISRVRQAEALLIAGGNQRDYVRFWKDTALETAIHALAAKNVPIAGNSAGLAILGEFAFTAEHGPIRSASALANPFDSAITFSNDFLALPYLDNVILDSHFDTRDRIGRLIAFMSRLVANGRKRPARGIGVSVGTALLIENGWATRVGNGAVYFLEAKTQPEVLRPQSPLTHRDILIRRLDGTGKFDMRSWSGHAGSTVNYSISVVDGTLNSSQTTGAVY